jgi:hypothetical protein
MSNAAMFNPAFIEKNATTVGRTFPKNKHPCHCLFCEAKRSWSKQSQHYWIEIASLPTTTGISQAQRNV